ncbi:hypothetical protein GH714_039244 [Hevea brasiliensis]|uniref:Brix domain-containing protein n=1 Tax=Hevea brasiliensis TaxID=3981 RepID=A0A6A6MSM2_HEVBR|nr:hypothetical protein GH714_039244 [Hevea brasiliensis]
MVHGSVELDAVSKEAVDLENMPLEEVFDQIKCRREGLSSDEVQERLDLFGYNKLEEKKENKILKFLGFMWNPLSWVMEAAALMAIALAHGGGKSADYHDFFGILILLLINSTISFIEEAAALMARLAPKAKVLRNGKWSEEDASELVPPLILGVSKMAYGCQHFLILSKTETASYLRVARTPQGPTLIFKIHEYSTAQDVAQSLLRPRCPQDLFKNPQLIVLSGFGSGEQHLKLTTIMFQNIFPAIDINTEKKRNNLRDFLNVLGPMGVTHFLILSKTETASYLRVARTPQGPTLTFKIHEAGYGSESEADDEAATVTLASDLGRVNRASTKSAVKLQEIGPRMTLQLIKVEEGLCLAVSFTVSMSTEFIELPRRCNVLRHRFFHGMEHFILMSCKLGETNLLNQAYAR